LLVVFSPGYPEVFRGREEVLAAGVAAAFNLRLTLDADGIRDGTQRAVDARRHLKPRWDTGRRELLGPFPVGLVAHSHRWKGEGSAPLDNVTNAFVDREDELARHPRECLDLLGVADLATWSTARNPWLERPPGAGPPRCLTSVMAAHPDLSPTPVAGFVNQLWRRLSYDDPSLRPMAAGLWALELLGGGGGRGREWELDALFSDRLRQQLP
jgi:hypothetical protein